MAFEKRMHVAEVKLTTNNSTYFVCRYVCDVNGVCFQLADKNKAVIAEWFDDSPITDNFVYQIQKLEPDLHGQSVLMLERLIAAIITD